MAEVLTRSAARNIFYGGSLLSQFWAAFNIASSGRILTVVILCALL